MPYFLARTISGNAAFVGFTFVYKLLPLGVGSTMIATNPFAIMGLAYCFLGDRVSFVEITALVVSFSGIVLMAISNPSSK